MRRREFITLVGGVAAWLLVPHAATAQPSDRVRRIAMLSGFAATDPEAQARVAALQQGLKELGWTEGRNASIEFRWGTGGAAQLRARRERPCRRRNLPLDCHTMLRRSGPRGCGRWPWAS